MDNVCKYGILQGDRTRKVGVVDSEYIVHKGIQTLGGSGLPAKKVLLCLFSHFLVASSLLLKHKI